MPLYEFQCDTCGQRFERLLWSGAASGTDPVRCGCGSAAVERILYSRVSIGGAAPSPDTDCGSPGGCCGGACRTH